jgi:hypothetical protein
MRAFAGESSGWRAVKGQRRSENVLVRHVALAVRSPISRRPPLTGDSLAWRTLYPALPSHLTGADGSTVVASERYAEPSPLDGSFLLGVSDAH